MKVIMPDILIECRSCSLVASEREFGSKGEGEQLQCPRCHEVSNLWDYEGEV